jgi:hypothetical protein
MSSNRSPHDPPDGLFTAPPKLLRCQSCGNSRACSDPELLSYVGDGWPACCGQTMALFVEAVPPKKTDGVL